MSAQTAPPLERLLDTSDPAREPARSNPRRRYAALQVNLDAGPAAGWGTGARTCSGSSRSWSRSRRR